MPDYYAILGVPQSADADEIKRAYRKLARESHPDANPTDPHAEERFKQISEAYQILSDPQSRQRYDTFGDGTAGPGMAGFGDLGDIVEAFFGGSPFGRARARTRTSAVAGQDVGLAIEVTLEEAVFGTQEKVSFTALSRCQRCSGDGCEPGTFRGKCSRCGGQGEIRSTRNTILGTVMTSRPCPSCDGAGEAPSVPCTSCGGAGRRPEGFDVTVDVPAGVQDGMTLRVRGRGEQGARGGPDGDLFVRIQVEQHDLFERDGDDLVCTLAVPLTQAILGAQVPIESLDGEQSLPVPPGTQHGDVLRLRGLGAHRLDGRGRGDVRVNVAIDIPSKLSGEERALIEQLAQIRGEHVGGVQRKGFRRKGR